MAKLPNIYTVKRQGRSYVICERGFPVLDHPNRNVAVRMAEKLNRDANPNWQKRDVFIGHDEDDVVELEA